MSQYPTLDNQTNAGYNNNAAGYANQPYANAGYNASINQPYNSGPYQNQPPMNYNDPNYHDNYEIYNQGYSGRQKCIIIAAVIFFGLLVGGFIMFVSRRMAVNRYPYYWAV